ncbi:MAG: DUF975 family protein [Lachnospiraceae bacterium]|nr:DUF975 family protein [Lachnospiraceae bacterium]
MNRKINEIKRIARGNLTTRYKIPMMAILFAYLLGGIINMPFSESFNNTQTTGNATIYLLASILISLLMSILICGQVFIHLTLARLGQPKFSDIFIYFKNQPDRYIIGALIYFAIMLSAGLPFYLLSLISDYVFANSLEILLTVNIILLVLSMVACFVAYVSLTLFPFYLVDRQEEGVIACCRIARQKAKGQMKRMLLTHLSFIGWSILGGLSFGIGFVWVIPYYTQTLTVLYLDISGELSTIEYQKIKPENVEKREATV